MGGTGFGQPSHAFMNMQGVNEKQGAIHQVFGTDGCDSKDMGMFIAAGLLPRYQPLSTDGPPDASEAWIHGFGGMGGQMTEDQVIRKAKMMYPASAGGTPENPEIMPQWNQILAAGLTSAPDKPDPLNRGGGMAAGGGMMGGFGGKGGFGEFEGFPGSGAGFMQANGGGMGAFSGVATGGEAGDGAAAASGSGGMNMNFGANGFHFGAGFGEGESPMSESSEDQCPLQTAENCMPPCVLMGSYCSGEFVLMHKNEAKALRAVHKAAHSQTSTGFKMGAVEWLYCLWGLTTGLLLGVCYMHRTSKTSTSELKEALTMA